MACVYRHIRLDKNVPFYIGIGEKENRSLVKIGRNSIWRRITNKSKYRIEILFNDLTWEEACLKEVELISLYGRINLGTGTLSNMTDGGEGTIGTIVSNETKLKMSEIKKESFKIKENHPTFGKKRKDGERLRSVAIGRKWYTNGKTEKMFHSDCIEDGFILGRKIKKK